jgi:uncharacterized protein (DUF2267 family)
MNESKFLGEVEARSGLTRDKAYKVATAVLQELHDRLSPKEADDLAAQLPGEFKRMWHLLDAPGRDVRRTHQRDFTRHIAETVEIDEIAAERSLMATFKALQVLLNSPSGQEGEAWDIFSQLPKDLKRLWLSSAAMPKTTSAQAWRGSFAGS